jgi:hypothetical protein
MVVPWRQSQLGVLLQCFDLLASLLRLDDVTRWLYDRCNLHFPSFGIYLGLTQG